MTPAHTPALLQKVMFMQFDLNNNYWTKDFRIGTRACLIINTGSVRHGYYGSNNTGFYDSI